MCKSRARGREGERKCEKNVCHIYSGIVPVFVFVHNCSWLLLRDLFRCCTYSKCIYMRKKWKNWSKVFYRIHFHMHFTRTNWMFSHCNSHVHNHHRILHAYTHRLLVVLLDDNKQFIIIFFGVIQINGFNYIQIHTHTCEAHGTWGTKQSFSVFLFRTISAVVLFWSLNFKDPTAQICARLYAVIVSHWLQ